MSRKGWFLWELGKDLAAKNEWRKGEGVVSPAFLIAGTCTLVVRFYPAGNEGGKDGWPTFVETRSNSDEQMRLKLEFELCHGTTLLKRYDYPSVVFQKGESVEARYMKDIEDFKQFTIVHSLPDLCLRIIYCVQESSFGGK